MKCDHKLDSQINFQYEKVTLCMNEIHHTCDNIQIKINGELTCVHGIKFKLINDCNWLQYGCKQIPIATCL